MAPNTSDRPKSFIKIPRSQNSRCWLLRTYHGAYIIPIIKLPRSQNSRCWGITEAHTMNMADDLATALDPSLLMERAGQNPDDWQRDVLRSESKRLLLLCSRQAGKSTVTAALGFVKR